MPVYELARTAATERCRCPPSQPLVLDPIAAAGAGIGLGESTIVG